MTYQETWLPLNKWKDARQAGDDTSHAHCVHKEIKEGLWVKVHESEEERRDGYIISPLRLYGNSSGL